MRSGNAFCMDITGGQYGWHDPVMAWPEFERKRLLVVRDDRPFGARLQEGVSALMSNNFPAYWMWFHLDMSLTYVLKHILQDWFKRRGITPAKLFSQPEAPFQQHLKNIKQYTTEAFDKKIAAYEKDKIWLYKETGPNKSTIICDIAKMGWVDADPKEVAQDLNSVGLKLFP